jgi:hypothetical protein
MRLPYEDASKGIVSRDVIIDSQKGNDETGDGSPNRPLRTKRGVKKLIERMTVAYEKRRARQEREARLFQPSAIVDDFEAKHKAEREAAEKEAADRYAKQTEERNKREADRKAKLAELDGKIARCEVELTSLKKTYLETMHLFELAQLDLMAGMREELPSTVDRLNPAKALATQLHHLRMAIMERSAELDALTEEQGSKNPWSGIGWATALIGSAAVWAYQLFAMEKK